MNYIVMKNQKSKLIDEILYGDSLCIAISDVDFPRSHPYTTYKNYEQLSNDLTMLPYFNKFDSIVVYSNEKRIENMKYVYKILEYIDEDKITFTFKED